MASLSNYFKNKLIDHTFRTSSFTKPAALHVALFLLSPSASGGGTEVTGGSYARVQRDPLDANWSATQGGTSGDSSGTSGHTDNAADIVFPTPTADWGQVTAFAVFDAPTGGNLIVYANLVTPKTVNNGDPAPKFTAADVDVTLT